MNFSKILNWVFGIMAFIGVFLIIGAVGASDYAVEMGIYEPLTVHLKEYIFWCDSDNSRNHLFENY
jgi:hypothetical protein